MMKHKSKNLVSLFSGCGGMDLGFEGGFYALKKCVNYKSHQDWIEAEKKTGWVKLRPTFFRTSFANDIRGGAKAAWVPFFRQLGLENANDIFHLGSIVDFVKLAKRNGNFLFPNNVDVVTGGFPCQDFSVAGKRKGFKSHKNHIGDSLCCVDNPSIENRGMLYIWMREVIDIVRPKVFIAENVKGLISLKNAKDIIENDFRSVGGSGYIVIPARVLNAADYGVPQTRQRIFFFGFLKSALKKNAREALENENIPHEFDPYPIPTHKYSEFVISNSSDSLTEPVTVFDVLKDLPEPEKSTDPSQMIYSKARWYGKHCQGQTEVKLRSVGPTIRAEHHGNIEFRRLSAEHGGTHLHELKKGYPERRLTVRECARLQTFPDSYEFVRQKRKVLGNNLSGSEAYRLIGNAVPPLLGYHIAMRLQKIWVKLFKE